MNRRAFLGIFGTLAAAAAVFPTELLRKPRRRPKDWPVDLQLGGRPPDWLTFRKSGTGYVCTIDTDRAKVGTYRVRVPVPELEDELFNLTIRHDLRGVDVDRLS